MSRGGIFINQLSAETVVHAVSDVYSPGKVVFIFAPESSHWIEHASKTIETVEDIVYDDPNQDTWPIKLEGVPLHPRPRPEQPGKRFINTTENIDTANLLIFIEQVPDNLELPESKAVHLFVGIDKKIIAEKFPHLRNASPDIADPQFIVDGWVSSVRSGYCYYGFRKGSPPPMPGPPRRTEPDLPEPVPQRQPA